MTNPIIMGHRAERGSQRWNTKVWETLGLGFIREIEIKATPVRMAKVHKANIRSSWQGCGVRGTLIHCCWECKRVQPPCDSVWWFPRKLGVALLSSLLYPSRYTPHPTTGELAQPWSFLLDTQTLETAYMSKELSGQRNCGPFTHGIVII